METPYADAAANCGDEAALANVIPNDEPDPAAANALQEGLGGQFGEMRTMMQYRFKASTRAAKPHRTKI